MLRISLTLSIRYRNNNTSWVGLCNIIAFIIRVTITLMMEAECTSQMSVYSNETAWRYVPEGSHLQLRCNSNQSEFLSCYMCSTTVHISWNNKIDVSSDMQYSTRLFNRQKITATKLTPGTQKALYEQHVLSGCAEVVPITAMLLSNIHML
jgi:hypothetical protein